MLGILFSVVGVGVIIFNRQFDLIASPLEIALMFIAVGYSIVLKGLVSKYNPLTLIPYQNLIGIVFFLPLFLNFELNHFWNAKPTTEVWIALIELAMFASSLAFIFSPMD